MAKTVITGNAVTITSTISIDDIILLQKHNPEALKLYSENEDGKSLEFSIVGVSTKGGAGVFGIEFNGFTRTEEKYATFTAIHNDLPEDNAAAKEFVADKYGAVITKLSKLETTIPAAVAQVKSDRASIVEGIEIC